MFPGGDPTLKQFFVTITLKDREGNILDQKQERFGKAFEEVMRGPIPRPFINGGTTRHIPFTLEAAPGTVPHLLEASVSYALIPDPGNDLKEKYLATLAKARRWQRLHFSELGNAFSSGFLTAGASAA